MRPKKAILGLFFCWAQQYVHSFPCSLSEMSIIGNFAKTYVSGIDVSKFHSRHLTSTRHLIKFGFLISLQFQLEKPKLWLYRSSGKAKIATDWFFESFYAKFMWVVEGSGRYWRSISCIPLICLGKYFHSLMKYPRFENKFRSPGRSKLVFGSFYAIFVIEGDNGGRYTACHSYARRVISFTPKIHSPGVSRLVYNTLQ